MNSSRVFQIAVLIVMLTMCPGQATALSPSERCEAAKQKAAAKYFACRMKKEARATKASRKAPDFTKCERLFGRAWARAENRAAGQCPSNGDEAPIRTFITQYAEDLAALVASEPLERQVLTTGQSVCYDVGGNEVPCAGSGQDGEFQKGLAPQYADNGDGTITDGRTGLVWEKLSDDGSIHDKDDAYLWSRASTKVAILNDLMFAGYTDWRVPKAKELLTIVNYAALGPSVDAAFNMGCIVDCTVQTCSCAQAAPYWTSTPEFAGYAWHLLFSDGVLYRQFQGNPFGVRAVRGGS